MSEKISTVIFKVDLQCKLCYKKIKKALCKLQDRGTIQSAAYDEKNGTVTVSGPFDPKKLIKKVCCKASNVIKDIQIVEENKKPEPPPPAPEPVPEPAPEPPPQPVPEPAPEPVPEPAPEPAPEPVPEPAPEPVPEPAPEPAPEPVPEPAPEPAPEPEPEPEPPAPEPKKEVPEPPKPEPAVKPPEPVIPCPAPSWPPAPGCCCRPWYEAYYGGCRCCSCGCVYGPGNYWPPQPPPVVYCGPPPQVNIYGGSSYCDGSKTCEFIYEDEPSTCRIM